MPTWFMRLIIAAMTLVYVCLNSDSINWSASSRRTSILYQTAHTAKTTLSGASCGSHDHYIHGLSDTVNLFSTDATTPSIIAAQYSPQPRMVDHKLCASPSAHQVSLSPLQYRPWQVYKSRMLPSLHGGGARTAESTLQHVARPI